MNEYLLPAVGTWAVWGALFNDAALWPPVARRIWAANATLQAVTGITAPARLEPGYPGTCAVLIVDRLVVIKIFPPPAANDVTRERAGRSATDALLRLASLTFFQG